ncbi:MAG: alpha/beta hydrolase [Deltaproteobacteria bacterium]|nr:alpha/beta hydrolase [Deltaproteobacteria bacterium]
MKDVLTARGLIIPGLNGSGPGHWQTLWQEKFCFTRVEQHNWETPDLEKWVENLNRYITAESESVLLVAHSLGSLTVAYWAKAYPQSKNCIHHALLVAPPDVERSPYIPEDLRRFASHDPLPFPTTLIGSENDPYMAKKMAQMLARDWGSCFINAGPAGHINLNSDTARGRKAKHCFSI